jgi:hypothetical protein
MHTKSSTDRLEPILLSPYTLKEDPILTKLRILTLLPTCTKSRIEQEDPNLATPKEERALPMRVKEVVDKEEPR